MNPPSYQSAACVANYNTMQSHTRRHGVVITHPLGRSEHFSGCQVSVEIIGWSQTKSEPQYIGISISISADLRRPLGIRIGTFNSDAGRDHRHVGAFVDRCYMHHPRRYRREKCSIQQDG